MSQVKQSKAGRSASNVTQLFAMPPDGWEQRTGWNLKCTIGHNPSDPPGTLSRGEVRCHMSSGNEPRDLLVRLADVLRWMEEKQPRATALEGLIATLPGDVMNWLYRLDTSRGGYAQAVGVGATFGYPTAEQIDADKKKYQQDRAQAEHEASSGNGWSFARRFESSAPKPDKPTWPEATEPGRPALLKALAGQRSQQYLNVLAVPVHKAFAVWGWGGAPAADTVKEVFPLADWPALVSYRGSRIKNGRGPDWGLGNQIEVGKAELKRRTDAGITKTEALNAMGVELGLKPTAGRTVLDRSLTGERKRGNATQKQQTPTTTKVRDGRRAS